MFLSIETLSSAGGKTAYLQLDIPVMSLIFDSFEPIKECKVNIKFKVIICTIICVIKNIVASEIVYFSPQWTSFV